MNVNLPKWPALTVVGKKVTGRQAAEILIRTDDYMPDYTWGGNDRDHAKALNDLFGVSVFAYDMPDSDRQKRYDKIRALRQSMGILDLEYLDNSMIVSAWVGGPKGWCDWNGTIFCNYFNVGKWPSVEAVAEDWSKIAEAFPFLDLRSQLYSGETSESDSVPVVEFTVKNGAATVTEPESEIVPVKFLNDMAIINRFTAPFTEHGISIEELREKLELVYGSIPTVDG